MRASSLPSAAKLLPNDGEAQHDSSEPEHPYVTGSLGYNGKKDGKKMQTGFTHRPILVEGVDEPVQLHGVYACALRVEGARRRVDPRIGIGFSAGNAARDPEGIGTVVEPARRCQGER